MGFAISQSTPGLVNRIRDQQINLFDKAVELSKDGELSNADINKLEHEAKADGNFTGQEQLLMQGLKDKASRQIFINVAREAKFDPSSFSFEIANKLIVPVDGKQIEVEFSSQPHEAKRSEGDRERALETIKQYLPEALQGRWDQNTYNLPEMKKLFEEMSKGDAKSNPSYRTPYQRMELLQAYLTANYNHPGKDINWQGVDLQKALPSMPRDREGRKYIDCEAYSQISETLLGADKIKHFDVASGGSADGRRDHQVSIYTDGDSAWVISNNQVSRVNAKDGDRDRSPAEMIHEVHPGFDKVVADGNGPMRFNSNSYQAGMEVRMGTGSILIERCEPNYGNFEAKFSDPDSGETFHVRTQIDPKTGELSNTITPKQGDVFYLPTDNGQRYKLVMGEIPPRGTLTKVDDEGHEVPGFSKPAWVKTDTAGGYSIEEVR